MEKVLNVYKPLGKTPYQIIKSLKERELYKDLALGYAGRLDPMADGVLVVLVGEENKKRKEYELLPKKYTFSMLCGVTTDTYDVLGKVVEVDHSLPRFSQSDIQEAARSYKGSFVQSYPPYSSIRVNGHPLFYWARKDMIESIHIPEKTITVFGLELGPIQEIPKKNILREIRKRVSKVEGDFRQEEIKNTWGKKEKEMNDTSVVVNGKIICSSGTYVRSIIHSLGADLNTGATTLTLTRTAVGDFTIQNSLHVQ